jgi:hypothetical protein
MAYKINGTTVVDNSRNVCACCVTSCCITASSRMDAPSGNTASRPGSPATGSIYFDTDEGSLIAYNGTDWAKVGGAGATPTTLEPYGDFFGPIHLCNCSDTTHGCCNLLESGYWGGGAVIYFQPCQCRILVVDKCCNAQCRAQYRIFCFNPADGAIGFGHCSYIYTCTCACCLFSNPQCVPGTSYCGMCFGWQIKNNVNVNPMTITMGNTGSQYKVAHNVLPPNSCCICFFTCNQVCTCGFATCNCFGCLISTWWGTCKNPAPKMTQCGGCAVPTWDGCCSWTMLQDTVGFCCWPNTGCSGCLLSCGFIAITCNSDCTWQWATNPCSLLNLCYPLDGFEPTCTQCTCWFTTSAFLEFVHVFCNGVLMSHKLCGTCSSSFLFFLCNGSTEPIHLRRMCRVCEGTYYSNAKADSCIPFFRKLNDVCYEAARFGCRCQCEFVHSDVLCLPNYPCFDVNSWVCFAYSKNYVASGYENNQYINMNRMAVKPKCLPNWTGISSGSNGPFEIPIVGGEQSFTGMCCCAYAPCRAGAASFCGFGYPSDRTSCRGYPQSTAAFSGKVQFNTMGTDLYPNHFLSAIPTGSEYWQCDGCNDRHVCCAGAVPFTCDQLTTCVCEQLAGFAGWMPGSGSNGGYGNKWWLGHFVICFFNTSTSCPRGASYFRIYCESG